MTRTQYKQCFRAARQLARFHRRPHDRHEAATWAMHEAQAIGIRHPSLDDYRAFERIGRRVMQAI
ncbi:hypothetical protein [Thiobaca trueperi]|uniref:Uncharacterized protein n=1 Tax=Thiobaca trueperi TaxID=127458 RepID=A0A4R3MZB1_9GAMM|nr:hypothetical protein [Thiobaca trueperi]TCT21187.1 hypothetical protein EDC35_10440 [Thiobaca trueperi]